MFVIVRYTSDIVERLSMTLSLYLQDARTHRMTKRSRTWLSSYKNTCV